MKWKKILLIVLIIILTLSVLFQLRISQVRNQRQAWALENINKILVSQSLDPKPNSSKELINVIESIDTLIHRATSHSLSSGYALDNDEITEFYIFKAAYTPAADLGTRLTTLYESDPKKYRFLNMQFNFKRQYWYHEHFMYKSLVEVLVELSLLRQRLILSS